MSLTRKLHTESTESHAAQQMHSTQGLEPNQGLTQLNDKNMENDLTSRRADSGDKDGLLKVDESDTILGETNDNATTHPHTVPPTLEADIDEARSASWGQPSAVDRETAALNANQHTDDADVTEGHS